MEWILKKAFSKTSAIVANNYFAKGIFRLKVFFKNHKNDVRKLSLGKLLLLL